MEKRTNFFGFCLPGLIGCVKHASVRARGSRSVIKLSNATRGFKENNKAAGFNGDVENEWKK